jgi:hypothetical protein
LALSWAYKLTDFSSFLVTEKQISEKLENIKKENAELMQKLSSYEQKV